MQSALFPPHKQQPSAVSGPQGRVLSPQPPPKLLPLEMQEGEAKWAQEGPDDWG